MIDSRKDKVLAEVQEQLKVFTRGIYVLVIGVMALVYYILNPSTLVFDVPEEQPLVQVEAPLPEYENGIHLATGFKEGENLQLVIITVRVVTQPKW